MLGDFPWTLNRMREVASNNSVELIPPGNFYSYRSAIIGSVFMARRAGA